MKKYDSIDDVLQQVDPTATVAFDKDKITAALHEDRSLFMNITLRVLTFLGGFLAVLFLAGFLMLLNLRDSEGLLLFLGFVFTTAALVSHRFYTNPLFDTAVISLYGAGIIIFCMGLDKVDLDKSSIAFICAVIASISFFVTKNSFINIISVLIINAAVLFMIVDSREVVYNSSERITDQTLAIGLILWATLLMGTYYGISFYEAFLLKSHNKYGHLYEPIRTGLVFSIAYLLAMLRFELRHDLTGSHDLTISLIAMAMIVLSHARILKRWYTQEFIFKALLVLLPIILLIPVAYAPSVVVSFYVLLVSVYMRHGTGIAVAIIGFVYFLGQYYYDLQFTLLWKSISMMIAAVVFLLSYFLLTKYTKDA